MRSVFLLLSATTVLGSPLLADPLRDAAFEYFAPLPATAPEIDGNLTSPEKLALGQALFFDTRISSTGKMSCASCHDLAKAGQDGLVTPVLIDGTQGLRNTSTVLNHSLNETYFWDGLDVDIAAMPAISGEHLISMLNTPEAAIAAIKAVPGYAVLYAAAFAGDADPITPEHTAQALEIFVHSLSTPSPFDAWLLGDDAALTDAQKAGLSAFISRGCSFCHFGPALGGTGYYPLGLVELPGVDVLAADEIAAKAANDPGAGEFIFRTAPLRNVALTAPYFHSGKIADLATAVDVMAAGQLGSPLDPAETASIVAFLESLSGTMPEIATPTLP